MTLPWGRGLLALLEICQSQRWRKWLITAKDCLIVDGEPVLWLVLNWKACRAAYWWLSFPRVMDFSSALHVAGLQFSCGGKLWWLTDLDFWIWELCITRGYAFIDFWHQPPIARWMGLMVLKRKPIQNELKIDVKGPSFQGILVHTKEDNKCVFPHVFCVPKESVNEQKSVWCQLHIWSPPPQLLSAVCVGVYCSTSSSEFQTDITAQNNFLLLHLRRLHN